MKLDLFDGWSRFKTTVLACAIVSMAVAASWGATDLRVSSDGHRLERVSNGAPFLLLSDTEWLLNARSDAAVGAILDDRAAKGFTAVQVFATHAFNGSPATTDSAGRLPFVSNDPTQLNGAYWARWRTICDMANTRGLHLILVMGEPGRFCDTYVPWRFAGNNATEYGRAYSYGRQVSGYFATAPNIIFAIGQDSQADGRIYPSYSTGGMDANGWRAMAEGVADGVNGVNNYNGDATYSTTLMTYHGCERVPNADYSDISVAFPPASNGWIDFYGPEVFFDYGSCYGTVNRDYTVATGVKPSFVMEGSYEDGYYEWAGVGTTITPAYVRIEAWQSLFGGVCGYAYGHCQNWQQIANTTYLGDTAAGHMAQFASFANTHKWWLWEPHNSLITANGGSGATRKVGVRSSAGDKAIVYFPVNSAGTIQNILMCTAATSWFDPRNGNTVAGSTLAAGASASLTPPAGWEDALLVLTATPRIMAVGDSNTMGVGNPTGTTDSAYVIGYRKKLKELLSVAGVTIDFVGSQSAGTSSGLTDPQHEGYPGQGLAQIETRVAQNMLESFTPDILLLLIGSNDMWVNVFPVEDRVPISDAEAAAKVTQLAALVDSMIARRPGMHIVVGKPATPTNSMQPLNIYRAGIDQIVAARQAQGKHISSVDMMGAANDSVHYTVAGYEDCAGRWKAEVVNVLAGTVTTNPPPAGPAELLANTGFESDTANWGINGAITLTRITTDKNSGAASCRVSGRTANWMGPYQTITSALLANGQGDYTVSAYLKLATGTDTGRIQIGLTVGGDTTFPTVATSITASGWTKVTGTLPLTWSGTLTDARFYVNTGTYATEIYVDDCSLQKGASTNATVVDPPSFSPDGGTFTAAQAVTITAPGASIRYTVDGTTTPTATVGTPYASPVTIAATTTLKAVAYIGTNVSTVMTALYTINTPPPSTNGMTNGGFEQGTTGWTVSGTAYNVVTNQGVRDGVSALALGSGNLAGNAVFAQDVATTAGASYTLSFQYGGYGAASKPQVLLAQALDGATVLQGATITAYGTGSFLASSTTYAERSLTFTATAASTTIRFTDQTTLANSAACDGMLDVVTLTANGGASVAQPSFSPDGGTFTAAQAVTITAPGASIRYTIDGTTTPTATIGTPYSSPVAISATTTLKAVAYVGTSESTVKSATYTITTTPPATNDLVNGSFEQGVTGWTVSGTAYNIVTNQGVRDGVNALALGSGNLAGNAVFAQDVATTAGASYTLTFQYGGFGLANQSQVVLAQALDGSTVLQGTTITAYGTGSFLPSSTTYAERTLVFTASSTTTTIRFTDQTTAANSLACDGMLDAISLNANDVGSLPSPWANADIGSVGLAGSASASSGTFTVIGAGADIWGTADAFHFVYQTASGDCEIKARVVAVQNTDPWAKVGVMVRESLNANATYAMAVITPSNGANLMYRTSTGGSCGYAQSTGKTAPYWVRVVRSGNSFTSYISPDGATWTQVGATQTISMGAGTYIGLCLTSHTTATLNTSTLDNVTAVP
ncbi:MAG: DUF4038 domain-containing protein [Lentisphaerae bacterium]|nr:DUF4038 domain-containing protein [Lentisphaerota bacterium]